MSNKFVCVFIYIVCVRYINLRGCLDEKNPYLEEMALHFIAAWIRTYGAVYKYIMHTKQTC